MEEGKHLMPAAAAACIPATASSITTHCMAILITERNNNRATPGAPSHSAAMAQARVISRRICFFKLTKAWLQAAAGHEHPEPHLLLWHTKLLGCGKEDVRRWLEALKLVCRDDGIEAAGSHKSMAQFQVRVRSKKLGKQC